MELLTGTQSALWRLVHGRGEEPDPGLGVYLFRPWLRLNPLTGRRPDEAARVSSVCAYDWPLVPLMCPLMLAMQAPFNIFAAFETCWLCTERHLTEWRAPGL